MILRMRLCSPTHVIVVVMDVAGIVVVVFGIVVNVVGVEPGGEDTASD